MAISNTKMKHTDANRRSTGSAVRGDFVTQPFFLQPVTGNADLTETNGFVSRVMVPGCLVPIYADGRVEYKVWNEADEGFQHSLETTGLSERFYLKWIAGAQGVPGINADVLSTTEAVNVIADKDFEILGTNISSGDMTHYAEGGLKAETDGADGDEVILLPHLDAAMSSWKTVTWDTDREVHWEASIVSGSAITKTILWGGLKKTMTEVKTVDADQVYFRYEAGVASGNWEVVSSIGGTDTSTDTGVVAAIDTVYHLALQIQADKTCKCYLNGALVFTTAALTTLPLIPYLGIGAEGTTPGAKHFYVRGQAISRLYA